MSTRTEPISQHGWFPDPEDPGRLRMWDGKSWTSLTKYPAHDEATALSGRPSPTGPVPHKPTHVQEVPAARSSAPTTVPAGPSAAPASQAPGSRARAPLSALAALTALKERPRPTHDEPAPAATGPEATLTTVLEANRFSFITFGLAVVVFIVASAVGMGYLGVLPALAAAWAYREREPMASLAALASASAIVIGLVLLAN